MFILLQDDTPTAVIILLSILFVTGFVLFVMTVLLLLICLLYVGLAMTKIIANIVRSPSVQQALIRHFPEAASNLSGETTSRCLYFASYCTRLATVLLACVIWFTAHIIGTGMFITVELLGPSREAEKPSAPAEAVIVASSTPLQISCNVEKPSAPAEAVTAANGTPLQISCSVEKPSAVVEAVTTASGTPLQISCSVEKPSAPAEAVTAVSGTPLQISYSVEKPSAARVDIT